MDSENVVCPVCTLYLRPGITLKSHLSSHPKQKVIEALVRLSNPEQIRKIEGYSSQTESTTNSNQNNVNQPWNQANNNFPVNSVPQSFSGNHSFIYQQFMSTTSPQNNVLNVNPLSQQYVTIPTVLNPQMMCPPYVYQQQQVIMSSGTSVPPIISRPLPQIEMPSLSQENMSLATIQPEPVDLTENDTPDLVIIERNIDSECNSDSGVTISVTNMCENETTEIEEESDTINKTTECCDNKDFKMDIEEFASDDLKSEKSLKEKPSIEIVENNSVEYDVNLTSPRSTDSDWNVRIRSDLSKACQTQGNSNNASMPSSPQEVHGKVNETQTRQNVDSPFYYDQALDCTTTSTTTTVTSSSVPVQGNFEQNESIYTAAMSGIIQSNDQISFMDMEGMHIILANDFMSNQLISQVEDFDCSKLERPQVLMTIGGMEDSKDVFTLESRDEDRLGDESMSRESSNVNIRADERMPPRGELSGQESNGGASDITWSRVQYQEANSGMSASYDLLGRESWETSDGSDNEISPLQIRIQPPVQYTQDLNDTPTIVSYTGSPLNFKCSTCSMAFKCLQDRQRHVKENHSTDNDNEKNKNFNIIGSKIGKSKVKKLVVKPKHVEVKTENNFDNIFTNKLKLETKSETKSEHTECDSGILPTETNETERKDVSITNYVRLLCSICNSPFPTNKLLKQHKLEVHNIMGVNRHKCLICGETFPNDRKYSLHLRKHPLECRLCGKYFYRRQNMQLHMKRHLGLKPFKCDICEKAFLTKQKHDEHRNIHTGDAPIKCSMCDETFRRHSNLVQHRNKHHFNIKKKVKDYICHCGEVFHSTKKLAWHKEIHDSKPKSCTQCSEKFIHMSSLTRHMRRAHNDRFVPKEERSIENVECPICKGVYLRSSLEVHIRNHSGQRPFTCLICSKDFTTKWNLKLHKWTHAARISKPFKCDQCKGAFIRETDYIAHMNSHKSVRPYTCNYCGAQFIRKYNCQRHVREHEKGKMFSCQVCGKSFHRSYYLKDHMRVHSGLRPYSCHICGKTSTTKSNHNKHIRIHHAREPVSTEN